MAISETEKSYGHISQTNKNSIQPYMLAKFHCIYKDVPGYKQTTIKRRNALSEYGIPASKLNKASGPTSPIDKTRDLKEPTISTLVEIVNNAGKVEVTC